MLLSNVKKKGRFYWRIAKLKYVTHPWTKYDIASIAKCENGFSLSGDFCSAMSLVFQLHPTFSITPGNFSKCHKLGQIQILYYSLGVVFFEVVFHWSFKHWTVHESCKMGGNLLNFKKVVLNQETMSEVHRNMLRMYLYYIRLNVEDHTNISFTNF